MITLRSVIVMTPRLSLFNAHYDERCFLPIHVYETATSRPVAVLLRPRFSRNHGTAVLLSASVELQSQYIQSRP